MRKNELYTDYHDFYEYFGNTEIERVCKQGEKTIRHDWINFDTVDEAMDFSTITAANLWAIMLDHDCF